MHEFFEIKRGFSEISFGYVKHETDEMSYLRDILYEKELEKALKFKPPFDSLLKEAEAKGDWGKKQEDFIEDLRKKISSIKKAHNPFNPGLRQQNQDMIKILEGKVNEVLDKKNEIYFDSAECVAQNTSFEYLIFLSLFKDKELKKQKYSHEEYEYLDNEDFDKLRSEFIDFRIKFNDDKIKNLAISSAFFNGFNNTDWYGFWGKPICDLTFLQSRLSSYGQLFKNIFKNFGNPPSHMSDDPDLIIAWAENGGKKEKESNSANGLREKALSKKKEEKPPAPPPKVFGRA